jgi:hypothetical protein
MKAGRRYSKRPFNTGFKPEKVRARDDPSSSSGLAAFNFGNLTAIKLQHEQPQGRRKVALLAL